MTKTRWRDLRDVVLLIVAVELAVVAADAGVASLRGCPSPILQITDYPWVCGDTDK